MDCADTRILILVAANNPLRLRVWRLRVEAESVYTHVTTDRLKKAYDQSHPRA